ncbi:hypothetical protein SAMN02799624_00964 [Paenibacillus sp. UNC496MF]|uniref:hypothetical protein n=1 Tax=Paenibacillus sp. UNC496MF TaxID=1502753 RepID=UPI0008E041F7|nr:hypothetical protein [Paenibacillus sp. UNC496MF]SFI48216.1 hypothetical protein SAMN02799624_00964 [Paenibacillus sp. UNC496MF]
MDRLRKTKTGIMLLAALMIGSVFGPVGACAAPDNEPGTEATLRVAAAPNSSRTAETALGSPDAVLKMLNNGVRIRAPYLPVSDTYLSVRTGGVRQTLTVDRNGFAYDGEQGEMIILRRPDRLLLKKRVDELRGSYYGTLLSWDDAKSRIPMSSTFALTDLETGKTFRVQRRAGSSHADVQPLTREDTEIMKDIYEGKWSWKRRAVLVETGDAVLAASMHGMPHGGDGIPDNGFSGHFCVHFLGSTTHKSRSVDPEHQLMVYKAAGKLTGYMGTMNPDVLAATFFKTYNLKELPAARMLFVDPYNESLERLLSKAERISSDSKAGKASSVTEDGLVAERSEAVKLHAADNRVRQARFVLRLVRGTPAEPWKIESLAATDGKGRDLLER